MTLNEGLVLAAAVLLAAVVLMETAKGTLTSRSGVLLYTLGALALAATLLHILAR